MFPTSSPLGPAGALELAARAYPTAARELEVAARAHLGALVPPKRSEWLHKFAPVLVKHSEWLLGLALVPPERPRVCLGLAPAFMPPQRSRFPHTLFLFPHRLDDCARSCIQNRCSKINARRHETLLHYILLCTVREWIYTGPDAYDSLLM